MNEIIKEKNILTDKLDFASRSAIDTVQKYTSSFSPDIFGSQKAQMFDEENYFELHAKIQTVSELFGETALLFLSLKERATEIYVMQGDNNSKTLADELNKSVRLCLDARDRTFSPYLCAVFNALALDSDERKNVNVASIRIAAHTFSVSIKEYVNNIKNIGGAI